MMEKRRVAFLFGAGAEGDGNFNIKKGIAFFRSSLCSSEKTKINDALKSVMGQRTFFTNQYKYRVDTIDVSKFALKSFIIERAVHNKEYLVKHNDLIVSILNDDELKFIDCELNREISLKHKSAKDAGLENDINEIETEFKTILNGDIKYSSINKPLLRDLFTRGKDDSTEFDINIGTAGLFDSYFHTIIDPKKYSAVRFSKVFNYYWACYFTILEDVLSFLLPNHSEFNRFFDNDKKLNYLYVLNNLEELTNTLFRFDVSDLSVSDSYYHLIRQSFERFNNVECVGVATTNYFRFCEIVHPKPIYLNGQLKLFEYPEYLEVADLTQETIHKEKLIFPFIFGQSLVKPIVSKYQTEEFHRLHKLLNCENGADILVVLGFNINEDDNHINAFLHDFVNHGKKLIIVTDEDEAHFEKKLRCKASEIHTVRVKYGNNKEVTDALFAEIMK